MNPVSPEVWLVEQMLLQKLNLFKIGGKINSKTEEVANVIYLSQKNNNEGLTDTHAPRV